MTLLDNEIARREAGEGGRLRLRATPLRVRWNFDELVTSDGHRLQCTFTCSVRALDVPTELRMLEETFFDGRSTVTAEDAEAHFSTAMKAAAERVARTRNVGELLDGSAREAIVAAVRDAGKAVAFSCGLELLPPFHLELQSPSFQRQQLAASERKLTEQRDATQLEHLQRCAELLKQFQAIGRHAPELTPGKVLDRVAPKDQGMMLQSLLLAAAKERPVRAEAALFAVAGPYLIRMGDAAADPQSPLLIPLPPTLGPLRSVQAAEVDGAGRLLVGAQTGVMLVNPLDAQAVQSYADPEITSAMGFSRAVVSGGEIWACHADGGIVAWDLQQPAAPRLAMRGGQLPASASGKGPRNLQVLDDKRMAFSIGTAAFAMGRDGRIEQLGGDSPAEVVAIVPDEEHVIIVREDGELMRYLRSSLELVQRVRRSGKVNAAAALPWLGSRRLLLATEEGPIYCVGFDDPLLTQYNSA
ncbi:MAG TPA: hypothetical protein VIL86_02705, partial [Tepidisphaeraceae bacterium]